MTLSLSHGYVPAPESFQGQFSELRKADYGYRERLDELLDLANEASDLGYYLLSSDIHWYRRYLFSTKHLYEEAIASSHEANRLYILYQKELGNKSYGISVEWVNLHRFYQFLGKVGEMFHAKQILDKIHSKHPRDKDGNPILPPNIAFDPYLSIVLFHLKLKGKPEQALHLYQSWVERLPPQQLKFENAGWWRQGTIIAVHYRIAELNAYLRREKAANEWRRKMIANFPVEKDYYAETYYIGKLKYLLNGMRMRGSNNADIESYKQALKGLSKHNSKGAKWSSKFYQSKLYSILNQTDEAVAEMGEILLSPSLKKNYSLHVYYLVESAKLRLSLNKTENVKADLRQAMSLARQSANLLKIPEIYFLFAKLHALEKDYEKALDYYFQAIKLFESQGRETDSDLVRIQLFKHYVEAGKRVQAEGVLKLIENRIALGQLPDMTRLKVLIVKYMTGYSAISAVEEAQKIAKTNDWGFFFKNELKRNVIKKSQITKFDPQQVFLDPMKFQTTIGEGELARANYNLSNLSYLPQVGRLKLAGRGQFKVNWNDQKGEWKVDITSSPETTEIQSETVTIYPEEQILISINAEGLEEGKYPYRLEWESAENLVSNWNLEIKNAEQHRLKKMQIVDASVLRGSELYPQIIYHEFFIRKSTGLRQDFRVRSESSVYVEVWDAGSGTILAVDAETNGVFSDAGDVLTVDDNLNGFPDIETSRDNEVIELILKIMPPESIKSGDEIKLIFESMQGNETWNTESIDVIRYN